MTEYFLFGNTGCDLYNTYGFEKLCDECVIGNVYGTLFCFDRETMKTDDLLDAFCDWLNYQPLTEKEYKILREIWCAF